MKPTREVRRIGKALSLYATALLLCATINAQQQPPRVTGPATSSAQATPRSQNSPYGSAVGVQTNLKVASGSITGLVYWDMSSTQYKLTSPCQGLTVTVSTISKPQAGGGQVLATATNFTPMGPLTDLTSQGTPKYMLCSYSFQKIPTGEYLRVTLTVQSSAFSPVVSVQSPPTFEIFGGNCNQTPSSTLSFILGGGEMVCGNSAFNVNFKLLSSISAGLVRPTGSSKLLPGAPAKPGGLLSKGASGSSLDTGATPNTIGGATLLLNGTNTTSSGGTLKLNGSSNGVTASSGGTLLIGGPSAGAFTGGVRPALPAMQAGGPAPYVPKMPPMQSNAKRDAAPPADAATKAQIKSKLQTQLAALKQRTARSSASAASNSADSKVSEIQALQGQKMYVESLRTQAAQARDRLLVPPTQNLVVRNQPPTGSILHPPQHTKICLAPQIHAVNGKSSGVVFSQDPKTNDYIISGCDFGTQKGQVYLSGAVTGGRIDMVVTQWTEAQIEAVVQPGLTGVLDGWPDLIVVPASAPSAKFPGSRFYAQRQRVLLPTIPQQYVTLANVTVGDTTHGFGTKYCPGPDVSHLFPCIAFNAGPPLDGITNGHDDRNGTNEPVSNAVDRDGGQMQFDSGEDIYDLSYMAPGFEIENPVAFWYAWTHDVCEGWASDAFPKKPGDSVAYDTEGHYSSYKKTRSKIVVDWGVDHCAWRWLGVFKVDDWYNSGYSLQVYVDGPIGVDPWTGRPTS